MTTTSPATGRGPSRSPWGPVQHAERIGRFWSVYTAGHGGILAPAEPNATVHPAWRNENGWYEEDCEWAIVAVTFPEDFPDPLRASAEETARNWFPVQYVKATGKSVDGSKSFTLREQANKVLRSCSYVVRAAWGPGLDGVPAGMVGVCAHRAVDEAEGWFLVPEQEYRQPGGFYVIDESRHQVWADHTPGGRR